MRCFALRCHRVLDPIENDVREPFSDVNIVSEMRSRTEATMAILVALMQLSRSPLCDAIFPTLQTIESSSSRGSHMAQKWTCNLAKYPEAEVCTILAAERADHSTRRTGRVGVCQTRAQVAPILKRKSASSSAEEPHCGRSGACWPR